MSDEAIFDEARKMASPAQRAAYLDQACGADTVLRAQVEALLAADEQTDSLLDDPILVVGQTKDFATSIENPGDSIGPYKLLQKIGEGGFGVVYLAEQVKPVSRRVAMKVIKPGMDSRQVIARFEAERQALAMMDHPNIAKVHDAGMTRTGRPYFVMELVKGLPITKFCDQQGLAPRTRLELFLPVCHAIQHAHQKGVIHRDIKPSNILVSLYDGQPVPKVIDFGVAKAIQHRLTEKTLFTEFGQVIGTLEYMSPEQAEMNQLDIDTRSDIYSLGAVLYELLTGTTPFDREKLRSAAFDEMLRIIREEEPLRPSVRLSSSQALASISAHRQTEPAKLSRLVRGELDWITMKALDKQRSRRYETANALARDVERYLSNEPVEASPASMTYRIGKLFSKYRASIAIASAFVILLSAATVISSIQWRRAAIAAENERQAKKNTSQALATTQKARDRAVAAESALSDALQRAIRGEAEANRNLYVAHMQQIQLQWEENGVGRIRELLDLYRAPGLGEKDPRGLEWYYWDRMCHLDLRTLIGHKGAVMRVAFSPDSSRLASGGVDGKVILWEVATGRQLRTLDAHVGEVTGLVFHPDGRRLFSGGNDKKVTVWDFGNGTNLHTLNVPASISCLDVSHDGRLLAVGCIDGNPSSPTSRVLRTTGLPR